MRQLIITKQLTPRNEESIDRYLNEIVNYPMITADEEVELSERIKRGDNKALEKLVLSNLRFVISVAKQYLNHGLPLSDLVNEGNIGLVKAARLFDASRGFKFISYAVWWIRQAIVQAVSDQTRVVRLPMNRVAALNKIRKAIPYLEQIHEREPTDEEIAVFIDEKNESVTTANGIISKQISINITIKGDNGGDFSLCDTLPNDNISPPDTELMYESLIMNIKRAMSKLSMREATVLTLSFGLGNSNALSLREIADEYEMSSERIRQIRNSGLRKLRELFADNFTLLCD